MIGWGKKCIEIFFRIKEVAVEVWCFDVENSARIEK